MLIGIFTHNIFINLFDYLTLNHTEYLLADNASHQNIAALFMQYFYTIGGMHIL